MNGQEHDDSTELGGIKDILGFHIRLAYGAVYRHFTESFTHLELTQKQVSVLWLIFDHPGIAQSELGRLLQMDRATVMAIINRLQARDFVRREKMPGDARKQSLFLDPAGVEALIIAKESILMHEQWLKSRFSKSEVNQLINLLKRIHHD